MRCNTVSYSCDVGWNLTGPTLPEITIAGVGGLKVHTIGQGSINLRSECDGKTFILELKDVLYVPKNRNNLLLLGWWEMDSQSIHICNGQMTLLKRDSTPITRGMKVCNKLYRVTFKHAPGTVHSDCMFNCHRYELQQSTRDSYGGVESKCLCVF